MSIFDRSRLAATFAGGLVAVAFLRCGAPEQCIRISDCAVGLTCIEGACAPPGAGDGDEASATEASVVEASIVDAPKDSGDASPDAATDADVGQTDASDDGAVIDQTADF